MCFFDGLHVLLCSINIIDMFFVVYLTFFMHIMSAYLKDKLLTLPHSTVYPMRVVTL